MASLAGTLLEAERRARATLRMNDDTPRTEDEVRRALRKLIVTGAVKHPDQAVHATSAQVQAFYDAAGAVKFLSELYVKLDARKVAGAADKSRSGTRKPSSKPHYAGHASPRRQAAAPASPPPPPPPAIPAGVDAATRQFLQQFHASGTVAATGPAHAAHMDAATRAAIQSAHAQSEQVPHYRTAPLTTPVPVQYSVKVAVPAEAIPASVDPETRRFIQDFLNHRSSK